MKTIQFREAICEAMSEEMRRDESIFLLGEDTYSSRKKIYEWKSFRCIKLWNKRWY